MNELDGVLSVKNFVEDFLAKFYKEKPLLINWVKIVELRNITWNLSIRVKFKDREYGLAIYADAFRKICIGHAITGIAMR